MGIIERLSCCVWGPYTVALVMLCGVMITAASGCPQIRVREWMGNTIGKTLKTAGKRTGMPGGGEKISPFQSATAALAGTIGTGNIIGVAAALSVGGPPSILWMWAAAFAAMGVSCAENRLGVIYRGRDVNGAPLGGPMLYMSKGLGMRRLASAWAGICALAAFGVGNITQVNSISVSAYNAFGCPRWLAGALVCCFAAPAVLGGMSGTVKLTEKLVPFMAAAYIISCTAVIVMNIDRMPDAFAAIFSGILSPRSVSGGITAGMLTGVRRGVFTNEAGMGSSVIINASAEDTDPRSAGCWGMFEVFFDTVIMCTLTALAVITSGAYEKTAGTGRGTSVTMSAAAFEGIYGKYSGVFIACCLLLFAFSTVVSWCVIGERAFCHIAGAGCSRYYRLLYTAAILPGAVLSVDGVWAAADIINACMLLPNILSVAALTFRERKKDKKYY